MKPRLCWICGRPATDLDAWLDVTARPRRWFCPKHKARVFDHAYVVQIEDGVPVLCFDDPVKVRRFPL